MSTQSLDDFGLAQPETPNQTEQALRESETRFRAIANASPAIIWTADPSGAITFHNQRWLDYTGLTREENALDGPRRALHPDDYERTMAAWSQALKDETEYEIEIRNRRYDGEYRWFLTRATPERDEAGQVIRWIGSTTDIHDRKLAEEALLKSEQRFARFMDNLPGLAWIKDTQGRYIYANEAAEKAFRTPLENLLGKTDFEIFPAQVAEQFSANDQRALHSEAGIQAIETLEHEDGKVHHSIVSKFPIPETPGKPALIGGMAIDITERQDAEVALRESEERFRRLISVMPSAMFTCDASGLITYYNQYAAELWGREPRLRDPAVRFIGAHLLFQPDGTPFTPDRSLMAAAVSRGVSARNQEVVIQRPDGTRIIVSQNVDPLYNDDGLLTGAISVFQDITARKQAEAEQARLLLELEQERLRLKELAETLEERVVRRTSQVRDLASALSLAEERERLRISHVLHDDLQQLLYSQLMRLELLRKAIPAGQKDELEELVAGMEAQMTQAVQVTRALAAELNPPDETRESLGDGLEWLARHMLETHGLKVALDCREYCQAHMGELQGLLLQIVRELLFNVVKHAGTDQAQVELSRLNGFLVITVRDQGVGFNMPVLPLAGVGKDGFGLQSISDRLQLLGGRLDVDTALEAGTRVSISVPIEVGGRAL